MNLRNKKGQLTAYGLRCGYRAVAESPRGAVQLKAAEHGKGYHVQTYDPKGLRLTWETYDSLKHAREAFAAAKKSFGYVGPVV